MTNIELKRYFVCGVPITACTPDGAAAAIVKHAETQLPLKVHLCNAYTLSLVDEDPRLREALRSADLNLPDGVPVAWLGRHHGTRGPVRGPGLVGDVISRGVSLGLRHYLYGGAPGVAALMAGRISTHTPGARFVGTTSPPYTEITESQVDSLADDICRSDADIVWVGLGTPRQDYLVPGLAERTSRVVIPVGAAFDFWSGRVREAPRFLQGSGLEWVYRLTREPRRLWRRYVFGNPQFLRSAIRHATAPEPRRPST